MRSKFDFEYSTQFFDEVFYLKQHGFRYCYVKNAPDSNIKTFKYKRSPELFRAVADFYEQFNLSKAFDEISNLINIANSEPMKVLEGSKAV